MMPTGMPQMPQGMPMQQPQHQQFMQQLPMQQPPPPVPVPSMQQQQQPSSGRVVDYDHFVTVRDAAVQRMVNSIDILRKFTTDYIRQTNLLLGDTGAYAGLLAEYDNAAGLLGQPVGDLPHQEEGKKERKKRTHDPDAPKRPLTPYFLYMQNARSIIANDLGPEAPKGAVQEEGQRRWATMDAVEKKAWNEAYRFNLRLYNARVHSYKAGNMDAKNMNEEEANDYANANGIPMPDLKGDKEGDNVPNDQDAIARQLQQVAQAPDLSMGGEEADGKTPKKAAGGRKRRSEAAPAEQPDVSKLAAGTPASPDKKRRRTSAKPTAAETPEEPKKSGRKKATKSS